MIALEFVHTCFKIFQKEIASVFTLLTRDCFLCWLQNANKEYAISKIEIFKSLTWAGLHHILIVVDYTFWLLFHVSSSFYMLSKTIKISFKGQQVSRHILDLFHLVFISPFLNLCITSWQTVILFMFIKLGQYWK